MPILSGNVVLVQRRVDDDIDSLSSTSNLDYDAVTNDNINLAGGYYNTYAPADDAYSSYYNNNNNYNYDPYYGYDTANTNLEGRKLMTFGNPSFYFGDWIDTAGEYLSRASHSLQRLASHQLLTERKR